MLGRRAAAAADDVHEPAGRELAQRGSGIGRLSSYPLNASAARRWGGS
jgi:hypothetical protein